MFCDLFSVLDNFMNIPTNDDHPISSVRADDFISLLGERVGNCQH